MTATTHRLGGFATGTVLVAFFSTNVASSVCLLLSSLLGSLLPDIDNRHSRISHKWWFVSIFITIGQYLINLVTMMLPNKQKQYIRSLVGHRGISHSLFFLIFIPLIIYFVMCIIGYKDYAFSLSTGLFGGILSHLLFDMFSGGVPFFMPFTTKRIVLGRIKTGGIMEWIFRISLTAILVLCGFQILK